MKKQKEKYILFCQEENAIPIFSQPWWLDAVCDYGYWDVAIVERGGQIWATMPYYIRKRYGFTFITMRLAHILNILRVRNIIKSYHWKRN